ncbi:MAG: HEAT repeat domain-containing protein [Bacteroidota bacterium]
MQALDEITAIEWWMDHLAGVLDEAQERELRDFLRGHPALSAELKVHEETWNQLSALEGLEPSPAMDTKFEAALQGYMAADTGRNRRSFRVPFWFQAHWQMALAFTMVGLAIGYLVVPRGDANEQISQLSEEVLEMKKVMMLTLIEQPKAQERIKAVSIASELEDADEKVIEVLAKTLATDDNINVRLAAIESLMKYWDRPEARQVLVSSITQQASPLVQVAIADAMLALREKEAINEFEKLIDDQELDESVKMKIENTIDQLRSI